MKNYYEFLLEKQIQLIKESILYFSPKFRKELSKIPHPISKDILSKEGEDLKQDITFLDMDDKEGYVTFKTMKSVIKSIDTDEEDEEETRDFLKQVEKTFKRYISDNFISEYPSFGKSRNPIKIGKLINTLFPGKYTPGQIEDFTNKYKSLQKGDIYKIEVVEGDEIAKWYHVDNYFEREGQLGSSCMRNKLSSYFEIYTKNPEVCKMVCLLQEDEMGEMKLRGRALLWKVDIIYPNSLDFEWFMDRQYTIFDSEVETLRKWADEKGYAYKTYNSFGYMSTVTYKGETHRVQMEVNLGSFDYNRFPYVDTFRRYDPQDHILFNDDNEDDEGFYLLNDTGGDYEETGNRNVYSEWYGDSIPEDESVWSDNVESYIYENRAVYVQHGWSGHHGWWPDDHDEIVYTWYRYYAHLDDCYYSDYYGDYILQDRAVPVVTYVDEKGKPCCEDDYLDEDDDDFIRKYNTIDNSFWYEHLDKKKGFYWEDYSGILKSLLTRDYNDNYILKDFSVELYQVLDNKFGLEYIDKGLSILFNIEISTTDEKLSDGFEYIDQLSKKIDLKEVDIKIIGVKAQDKNVKHLQKLINAF